LLTEGADLLYVSGQLGHAKPTTTMLYYAHFMPRGDKQHLDRMMARRGGGFSPSFAPEGAASAASR
jgi:integrase